MKTSIKIKNKKYGLKILKSSKIKNKKGSGGIYPQPH
jgi:hypothetical protein